MLPKLSLFRCDFPLGQDGAAGADGRGGASPSALLFQLVAPLRLPTWEQHLHSHAPRCTQERPPHKLLANSQMGVLFPANYWVRGLDGDRNIPGSKE